jgi:hypothetical protein
MENVFSTVHRVFKDILYATCDGRNIKYALIIFFFFPVPVCAITESGVPGGTFVSMNRFSSLCG